jgi:hypothetical protein
MAGRLGAALRYKRVTSIAGRFSHFFIMILPEGVGCCEIALGGLPGLM